MTRSWAHRNGRPAERVRIESYIYNRGHLHFARATAPAVLRSQIRFNAADTRPLLNNYLTPFLLPLLLSPLSSSPDLFLNFLRGSKAAEANRAAGYECQTPNLVLEPRFRTTRRTSTSPPRSFSERTEQTSPCPSCDPRLRASS